MFILIVILMVHVNSMIFPVNQYKPPLRDSFPRDSYEPTSTSIDSECSIAIAIILG